MTELASALKKFSESILEEIKCLPPVKIEVLDIGMKPLYEFVAVSIAEEQSWLFEILCGEDGDSYRHLHGCKTDDPQIGSSGMNAGKSKGDSLTHLNKDS